MAGFGGLQFHWLDGNGSTYCLTNIVGACFVVISLTHAFNLASALIQVAWIVLGLPACTADAMPWRLCTGSSKTKLLSLDSYAGLL